MDRRLRIFIFFIAVFVLPICWYLFLQLFGENNYALSVIREYRIELCEVQGPVLLTRDDLVSNHPNQFARISKQLNKLNTISFYGIDSSCMMGFDMLLIDKNMMIRGEYKATRDGVDRMLTEVDILLNYREE